MQKTLIILLVVSAIMAGCRKNAGPQAKDLLEQKLRELSGSRATNCGRVAHGSEVKSASDCAMQASQGKRPFYVAYDLPGLTVAIAGGADGKLYAVQSQFQSPQEAGGAAQAAKPTEITATPCPAELRVAQSGRVTCYAPGSFGMGSMGANPHGGMAMPPAGTPNPHGGSGAAGKGTVPLQRSSSN